MSHRVYAGLAPVMPEDLGRFETDVRALAHVDGFVFLDPGAGVHPIHLAHRLLGIHPAAKLVLPLVARDANRTALLAQAHGAQALGASGLLLVSGRLEPSDRARTVYELDPLQMLAALREAGVGLEAWVASRCETPAQLERVRCLGEAGASRCLVPWDGRSPCPRGIPVPAVLSVALSAWPTAGDAPTQDLLVELEPGNGARAAQVVSAARGGGS